MGSLLSRTTPSVIGIGVSVVDSVLCRLANRVEYKRSRDIDVRKCCREQHVELSRHSGRDRRARVSGPCGGEEPAPAEKLFPNRDAWLLLEDDQGSESRVDLVHGLPVGDRC